MTYNKGMPTQLKSLFLLVSCFAVFASTASRAEVEVFGKGSISKNFLAADSSTISVSMTGGLAISVFSFLRVEGRFTNISALQNKLDINNVGTLNDVMTETNIYSLGLDIDLAGEKSTFQPYVYIGAGYISTARSYYFTPLGSDTATLYSEPKQDGVSLNGGLGLRIRLAKALAIEIEAYAYATNVKNPSPLINWSGTAGLRIFI